MSHLPEFQNHKKAGMLKLNSNDKIDFNEKKHRRK